jgi:hypothetical protein
VRVSQDQFLKIINKFFLSNDMSAPLLMKEGKSINSFHSMKGMMYITRNTETSVVQWPTEVSCFIGFGLTSAGQTISLPPKKLL